VADLQALLVLQDHDLALDQLRHRHSAHPVRAELSAAGTQLAQLDSVAVQLRIPRDEVAATEKSRADEVAKFTEQAGMAEVKLYSGDITAPRELQALQADIEQLKRKARSAEDLELEAMEIREPLDTQLADIAAAVATVTAQIEKLTAELTAALAELDYEITAETEKRNVASSEVTPEILADYDRRRANGTGAARLVGTRCEGCHLTIPNAEAEKIRKAPAGTIASCENCGCILVP